MSMVGTDLATALKPDIKSAIEGFFGAPDNDAKLDEFCTAMANAIGVRVVAYIKANAQALPGTFSNSGGPVTGLGTVT